MRKSPILIALLPCSLLVACANDRDPTAIAAPRGDAGYTALRGAKLAQDVCGQCHGELTGTTLGTPAGAPLCEVRSYTLGEFTRLLSLGVARNGNSLDARMNMTQTLTEDDHAALYAYLQQVVANRPTVAP